ncbi:AzlC family ABC transporter permease [Globicatella sulfidifaciens]|uniref:4-azaleucine resistance probable transporter AzlC n=1 Tax=Globicatella sulfidifaciens DSM 15739 TaxID=1121925 RepID=A0A1T4JZ10_9LACT|nr:AzlC family ABC transporter permease [Globicatella sulfidifaciens]SJZ35456.1 4-azaleucine resistance probable transporter AzlC [Globicatella sulfidifaciens DSM 15739]
MKDAFKFAFPKTIPIFTGFLFLGISYGIFATSLGFHPLFPIITSAIVYAGSMEFVTMSMLLGTFNPIMSYLLTLMVNARHIFYGLSMLDKFKNLGWKKFFIIFGMCDETFSINVSLDIPEYLDKSWVYFHVTWLNQMYWVFGTAVGAIFGNHLPFDTQGIDFVLNALFIVLLLDHWLKKKQHHSVFIGLLASLLSLIVFGAENFMIPAMVIIILIFSFQFFITKPSSWER